MFGTYFYNQSIRRITAVFGTLFNNISITRSDGNVIKVPVSTAIGHKYLKRLNEDQKDDDIARVAQILPRMSYQMVGMTYDPTRQLSSIGKYYEVDEVDPDSLNYLYQPSPYNFDFEMNIAVKHMDDGVQILEQILPFFNPEFQITIFEGPGNTLKRNIPIILQGVSLEDTYEGSFLDRRMINYTLNFMIKGYIYGPKQATKIIKEVDINVFLNEQMNEDPFINYDAKPDPLNSDSDDDFGYTETITENNNS